MPNPNLSRYHFVGYTVIPPLYAHSIPVSFDVCIVAMINSSMDVGSPLDVPDNSERLRRRQSAAVTAGLGVFRCPCWSR